MDPMFSFFRPVPRRGVLSLKLFAIYSDLYLIGGF